MESRDSHNPSDMSKSQIRPGILPPMGIRFLECGVVKGSTLTLEVPTLAPILATLGLQKALTLESWKPVSCNTARVAGECWDKIGGNDKKNEENGYKKRSKEWCLTE